MIPEVYGRFFLIRTLARAAFAAVVLASAAAHAEPPRGATQHQVGQGNDYNFVAGGGG